MNRDSDSMPYDDAFIRRVATLVVARLRSMDLVGTNDRSAPSGSTSNDVLIQANPSASVNAGQDGVVPDSFTDTHHKVITAELVLSLPAGRPLQVRSDAVVTPLARDEAKDRGIEIRRSKK